MKTVVFYRCKHCGNVVVKLVDKGVPVFCCGEQMEVLNANTTDAALEKHVPVLEINGNQIKVTVGSTLHPMLEEHYIQFIVVKTNLGYVVKHLNPNEQPVAEFALLENEKVEEIYEYCNLHGLWMLKTN